MQSSLLLQQLENEYNLDLNHLIKDVKRYMPKFHEVKFRKAFTFAAQAHEGQLRKSGHPYIVHPFETVRILVSMHVDEDTLIAALLHDVPEDTERNIKDIETRFGKRVAFLVQGITKLSKVHYQHDMEKRQIESLKKLFIHTARDPRIILIKLADRLHNMRTLSSIKRPDKISRISRETLEIFVPIANLLGIEELKSELEDLCFKYLHPEDYEILSDRMRNSRYKNQAVMAETVELIENELSGHNISFTVYGRVKNLYHIYKRISGEINRLAEYDNMISVRIIVGSKEECYQTLGILHTLFKPKPGKFRDYISVPKRNGYQSLHTTVFGIKGTTTEFQIRTHQMHLEAEYGITAQYFKDRQKSLHLEEDERANWAGKILQMQNEEQQASIGNFMENLKDDIFHDRIFVFTPKGDSIDLPKDATCVDFAYEIHTDVGHKAIKAEVNGQIVPVTSKLHNNDTVNVITSDIPKGPSRSWLAFVKTNSAKSKILDYFKKISKEEKINTGKRFLQKEFDWAGLGMIKDIPQKKIKTFCQNKKNCKSIEDIYLLIGEGTVNALDFVNTSYPEKDVPRGRIMNFIERKFLNRGESKRYTLVTLKVVSRDAVGQLKKILNALVEKKLNALKTKAFISFWTGDFICKTTICVENYSQISQICESIEQIDGVKLVSRQFWRRKIFFILGIFFTFTVWAAHPYLLHYISADLAPDIHPYLAAAMFYSGIFMLFMMVFLLKRLTQRSFPELRETSAFWGMTFFLSTFAVITLFAEIYFFELSFNWLLLLGLILLVIAYLTSEYLRYRERS